jgi:CRP-like cAMP-binding protein
MPTSKNHSLWLGKAAGLSLPLGFDLKQYLSRLMLRSNLDEEATQAVLDLPYEASRKSAGSDFVREGEQISTVCIVGAGLISSFRENCGGVRQIMGLHVRGDMADSPSFIFEEAVCGLRAITDTIVLSVQISDLRRVSDRHPAVAAAIQLDAAVDAAVLVEWAGNVGRKSARSRLAHLFCEMAVRYDLVGQNIGLTFELPMTQEVLADATAITPVHLNRTLQSLRADCILEMQSRVVRILDWPRLVEVACFDPRYLRLPGSIRADWSNPSVTAYRVPR